LITHSPELIPPHSLDAERAVLGVVLLDPAAVEPVCSRLTAEDFYLEAHRAVFRAMQGLREAGHGVDGLTVHAALRESGDFALAGGEPGLAVLIEQACEATHLDDYLRLVLQQSGKRQQLQLLAQALVHAQNGLSPAELAQETADALAKIAERTEPEATNERGAKTGTVIYLGHLLEETVLDLRFGVPDLIPAPIDYLNQRFGGGFRRGEYVVLGGGPGVAKTALALEWARYVAQPEHGHHRVLVVSLEMERRALGARILSQSAMVSATSLRKYDLDQGEWDRIERILPQLAELPVRICDDVTRSVRSRAW
jgi:replicative DNA helicase